MKKLTFIAIVSIFAAALNAQVAGVEKLTLGQFKNRVIKPGNDTLYVVNFWATWCKPCVAELPYFELANKNFAGKKVKIILVSLDFQSEHEKVGKFVAAKKIQNTVYHLNAGNPNDWIDQIETDWDGAIPATVLYKAGNKLYFREGEFEKNELDSLIQTKIN